MEGDKRDTLTLVLVPCHCEHKEYVCDAGDTEQQENDETEQVGDPHYLVTGNNEPPRAEGI